MQKKEKLMMIVIVALVVLSIAGIAMAFMTPAAASGAAGWEMWDLIVNKFIKGPIGTATGVVMLVAGAVGAAMGKLSSAVWPLVGGGALATAPSLAVSLGMIF